MITFIEKSIIRAFTIVLLISISVASAYSQHIQTTTINKSRLSVTATDSKTNILVTGFPAKTTVVVFDNDNNLLSIVSTNDDGAASLTLPSYIVNTIYVKTLNDEIVVSSKASNEGEKVQEIFAVNKRTSAYKG
jgi:hypothetical protein